MRSLSARLLIALSILLIIALTVTAIILDRVFQQAAEDSTAQRLNTQLILLMSSAEIDAEGQFSMPELLPEARFMTPDSGLMGFVNDNKKQIWKSESALGMQNAKFENTPSGQNQFSKRNYNQQEYFQQSLSVEWEIDTNKYQTLVFTAAESLEPYYAQLKTFRTRIFSWFAFLVVCLVTVQASLMRWILKPLRKIANEVSEIDQGKRNLLSDDYPSELQGVTINTNALIKAERSRMKRYQNTLGNLAHSLKTPLAVIQTTAETNPNKKEVILEQVKVMNDIVGYQLKRAATVGQVTLGREAVYVYQLTEDIIGALRKVYADKGISFENTVKGDILFYGDKGDLTEVIGNLLDNAAKWSKSKVLISANSLALNDKRSGLKLIIEDDGKGVDDSQKSSIMQRGKRADENTPGHGIGLSVVKEITQSYQGELQIDNSLLGGAKFTALFSAF